MVLQDDPLSKVASVAMPAKVKDCQDWLCTWLQQSGYRHMLADFYVVYIVSPMNNWSIDR
jgi:uncharacterized membrane protein YkvA (DUF1232 family)